ncbi:hypothetical protein BD413DRAFT_493727 [Trametes elegans]|nr:hypothetical protein BD413DRAFT_493727 [Trametes elegans]
MAPVSSAELEDLAGTTSTLAADFAAIFVFFVLLLATLSVVVLVRRYGGSHLPDASSRVQTAINVEKLDEVGCDTLVHGQSGPSCRARTWSLSDEPSSDLETGFAESPIPLPAASVPPPPRSTCSSFAKLFGRTRASDLAERTKDRSPLWPMLDDIARSFSRCSCRDQHPREVGCAVHPPTCTWMPHSEIPHIIVTPPGRQPPLLEPEVSSPASTYSESDSSVIETPPLGPSMDPQVVGAVRADTTSDGWSWSGAELGHPATEPGHGHSLGYYPVALGTIVEEDDEHGSPSSPFVARAKSAIAMDRGAGCSSHRDLLYAFASPLSAIGRAEDDNDDDCGDCYYDVLSDYFSGVQEVENARRGVLIRNTHKPLDRPQTAVVESRWCNAASSDATSCSSDEGATGNLCLPSSSGFSAHGVSLNDATEAAAVPDPSWAGTGPHYVHAI